MSTYQPGIIQDIDRSGGGTVLWVEFGARPTRADPGLRPLTSVIPFRSGFDDPELDPDAA